MLVNNTIAITNNNCLNKQEKALDVLIETLDKNDTYKQKQSEIDGNIQDIMHKMEFLSLDAVALSKLTKELRRLLRLRRYYKDRIQFVQSLNQRCGKQIRYVKKHIIDMRSRSYKLKNNTTSEIITHK